MSITIKGRDENLGIAYEVSGSTAKTVVENWNDLLQTLADGDAKIVGIARAPSPAVGTPATAGTDDVFYAEKQSQAYSDATPAEIVAPEPVAKAAGAPVRSEAQITHVVKESELRMREPKVPDDVPKLKVQPEKAGPLPKKMAKDGAVCSDCGRALEESEARTSKLFVSKLLCRVCMQKIGA